MICQQIHGQVRTVCAAAAAPWLAAVPALAFGFLVRGLCGELQGFDASQYVAQMVASR